MTAFMAVATKAAAFGVALRLFDVALIDAQRPTGRRPSRCSATITIIVGNVGALGQFAQSACSPGRRSRRPATCSRASSWRTGCGVQATVFYLAVYLVMNLAAFAVMVARERETPWATTSPPLAGIGTSRPLLAWPLTLAMLGLAGIPATAGLHRQVLPDRGRRRGRLHVARRGHRHRLDDLARRTTCGWSRRCGCGRRPAPTARPRPAGPGAGRAPTRVADVRADHVGVARRGVFGAATLSLGHHPLAAVQPGARRRPVLHRTLLVRPDPSG